MHDELNKLGIACDSASVLQDKNGVTVARIVSGENSYVVKCFQAEEHKREIENYRLLSSLGIPTIQVIASTDSALMFDYNLLGKGYAYTDLRNVMSSLSEEAGKAFLREYGEFDPAEKALDDVVSVVVTLYLACQRSELPWWAKALLDEIDAAFIEKIACLRRLL